jgi:hypothetical protein
MAIKYIAEQFVIWVIDFFRHWYIDSLFFFLRVFIKKLYFLDRLFALRVSFKNIFKPMYQDNSFIGYVMGFLFRSIRIAAALITYSFVVLLLLPAYLVWAAIPLYLLMRSFNIDPNVQNLL